MRLSSEARRLSYSKALAVAVLSLVACSSSSFSFVGVRQIGNSRNSSSGNGNGHTSPASVEPLIWGVHAMNTNTPSFSSISPSSSCQQTPSTTSLYISSSTDVDTSSSSISSSQHHKGDGINGSSSTDMASRSSSQSSSSDLPKSQSLRVGKFQHGVYDKPIVLIGCSGAGDELNRLAASIITALDSDSSASKAKAILNELEGNNNSKNKKGGIVPTVGANGRGTWVLSHKEIQPMISSKSLDKSSVFVLDFDAPTFNVENGKNDKKLTQYLTDLARALYEDEEMLVVYVNVHPEKSGMSRAGRERKAKLEEEVFIKYSDYEICVKDEGLDVTTVMTQKLLLNQNHQANKEDDDTSSGEKQLKKKHDDDNWSLEEFQALTSSQLSDPFTEMLTLTENENDDDSSSTAKKKELLDSIAEEQLAAWDGIEWHLKRLLARAFLPPATPGSDQPTINSAHLTMGQNAFFLSLSFPDVMDSKPYIESMCEDVDAMEFRADLLSYRDDRFELLHSLQKVRSMCRPHASRAPMLPFFGDVIDDSLPFVYTVRTAHQAGTYPDDADGIKKMFGLLNLGLRSGVEVLDVESAWDKTQQDALLTKVESIYSSQILGSHHMVGEKVSTEEAVSLFRQCSLNGRAHGAKVVLTIDTDEDDHQAIDASNIAQTLARQNGDPVVPHVSLILDDVGQYSRVLNLPFTPVTHESLPFKAAPGQMTANELMATRVIMGLVPPKKYAIIGSGISYSVSPAMHSAAFAATKLPHSYTLIDMEDVDELVQSDFWNDESFGGTSVTIPHKQTIIPHLDVLTDAAKAIGAVNTVIVEKKEEAFDGSKKRVLVGDNTDWKGIYNPLSRKLGVSATTTANGAAVTSEEDKSEGSDSATKKGVALILGGGGTARAAAYAAAQLGLERVYYNRTPSKAMELAKLFGGTVVTNLDAPTVGDPILEKFNLIENVDAKNNDDSPSLGSVLNTMNGEVHVVISTLPAAAEFEMPQWLVKVGKESQKKPIVFDVNYKPYWTKLLYQAEDAGFGIVRGSEMLWEQGVGQFELWTGRTAPYKVMKNVVLNNCLPQEDNDDGQ